MKGKLFYFFFILLIPLFLMGANILQKIDSNEEADLEKVAGQTAADLEEVAGLGYGGGASSWTCSDGDTIFCANWDGVAIDDEVCSATPCPDE